MDTGCRPGQPQLRQVPHRHRPGADRRHDPVLDRHRGTGARHNPIPVDLPPLQDQIVSPDTWFSESPYLGYQGDLPPNVTSNNQCGEYYHVAHSHALQQATNYGATFGGMMTLIRIDPPSPNTCPSAP